MKIQANFRTKLLFYLLRENSSLGFTLLELMIVMIILSILAAVALPNLVKQAGKAREVEFKNAIGTINRAQQAYHWEKAVFAQGATDQDSLVLLNIGFDSEYINSYSITAYSTYATVAPVNLDYIKDQTRAYSGGTYYSAGNYSVVLCQSNLVSSSTLAPVSPTDCGSDAERIR
jgi:type IV pilus assembly protein PilA